MAAVSRARAEWVGFSTIIIREFNRIVRIWGQTIVPPTVTATLYFVIFGSLIGRRVGQVGGYDYMQFIAPGLIMMTVITNSYANVVSSFFGAKFGKHLEELLEPVHLVPHAVDFDALRRKPREYVVQTLPLRHLDLEGVIVG